MSKYIIATLCALPFVLAFIMLVTARAPTHGYALMSRSAQGVTNKHDTYFDYGRCVEARRSRVYWYPGFEWKCERVALNGG